MQAHIHIINVHFAQRDNGHQMQYLVVSLGIPVLIIVIFNWLKKGYFNYLHYYRVAIFSMGNSAQ